MGKEEDPSEGRLRTHPDQHATGEGGRVVDFGEGRRAGAHDLPAHVEHPCSPQGQETHSEEEALSPEHASVLKGHRKAPDVSEFSDKSVAMPGTKVQQFWLNRTDTVL